MKKSVCRTLAFFLVIALAFSLIGCGAAKQESASSTAKAGSTVAPAESTAGTEASTKQDEQKPVKFRIYAQYSSDDEKIPYDYAAAYLKAQMPNVELELDMAAEDDGQKIRTYAATGNMPDIVLLTYNQINDFKASNKIVMLDKYAEEFKLKEKLNPGCENVLVCPDGHVWCFPYMGNEFGLFYYNKKIFADNGLTPPKTYDEMLNVVKTLKSKNIIPLSIFAKQKWINIVLYDMFITRMDSRGIKALENGEKKASDPDYLKATQKMVELIQAGLLPKGVTNLNYDQAAALFYEGKAAMFINGDWEIQNATAKLGENLDFMYFPAVDEATYEKAKYNISGGGMPTGFGIGANCQDINQAAKAAAIFAQGWSEGKYIKRGNPFVAYKTDKKTEATMPAALDKVTKELIPNISGISMFPFGISHPKFNLGLEDNCQAVLLGDMKAEDFAKAIDKAIEDAGIGK